jgi:hypothetical protein
MSTTPTQLDISSTDNVNKYYSAETADETLSPTINTLSPGNYVITLDVEGVIPETFELPQPEQIVEPPNAPVQLPTSPTIKVSPIIVNKYITASVDESLSPTINTLSPGNYVMTLDVEGVIPETLTTKSSPIIVNKYITASVDESLSTTINNLPNGDYTILIDIEPETVSVKPSFKVKYDNAVSILDKSDTPIHVTQIHNTDSLTLYMGTYSKTYAVTGSSDVAMSIPHTLFNKIGIYTVKVVASSSTDDTIETIVLNVTDTDTIVVPDIYNIKYPSVMRGADYVETDTDFSVSWDSVSTDMVKLYVDGELYISNLVSSGSVKLNVKQLLQFASLQIDSNKNSINIPLSMTPYNIKSGIYGKNEKFTVQFIKSDKVIPRGVVIDRFVAAFESQYDTTVFDSGTSKYLTHLLHLGDGNDALVAAWTGSADSLVVKMYEPLPTNVKINQQVWISKLQSNPIIETVTLTSDTEGYCHKLRGPNFSLGVEYGTTLSGYDTLLASGSTTSNDLLVKFGETNSIDTTQLDIQYVSGSTIAYSNFVHFSSAEERTKNFYYKLSLIEYYQGKYNNLISGSTIIPAPSAKIEADGYTNKIIELKRTFDGYENFLYSVSSSFAYPKDINGLHLSTSSSLAIQWYDANIYECALYDRDNVDYLVNNIPLYLKTDTENSDFIIFLDMIGQHFDLLWANIQSLQRVKKLEYGNDKGGLPDKLIYHLLQSFGWDTKIPFSANNLWESVIGKLKDGTDKYGMPLDTARTEVWRRILNNLPYLLKNKGTSRSIKAIMACYGVPETLLTIMEFGGTTDVDNMGSSKFTFDDTTAAVLLDTNSKIFVDWKPTITGTYPEAIELRIKPTTISNCNLLTGSNFSLDIVQTTGSYGYLLFNTVSGSYSASMASDEYPIFTTNYSHILVNRYPYVSTGSIFEIFYATEGGDRILNSVSMSLSSSNVSWNSGNTLTIGSTFVGNVDEFRLWTVPLEKSKFDNHTLFPDAINGNSYTSSTSDLVFRLDFEYPKDRTSDTHIKNVAINQSYASPYATAYSFPSASQYPYQYEVYRRTVTADVPSVGISYNNKIRIEDVELIDDLSYKHRSTKKSLDTIPLDSNRLGLYFSPNKELNMDILKAFGEFHIDDYIGDPSDEFNTSYKQLDTIRHYYFERLNRNINEYIQLVKAIDKSLFDVIKDLVPARAKVSTGLLIEPHYLERNKVQWKPTESEIDTNDAFINTQSDIIILGDNSQLDGVLDASDDIVFVSETPFYDTELGVETEIVSETSFYDTELGVETAIVSETPFYDTTIDENDNILISTLYETYEAYVDSPITDTSMYEEFVIGNIVQIGMNPNDITNVGFGLYAPNGIATMNTYDIYGNTAISYDATGSVIPNRKRVYVVTEASSKRIYTQTDGYPTGSGQIKYEYVPTTFYNKVVTVLPYSGSITPALSDNIVNVSLVNGYLPTHYKFVNNLTEGMKRSFYKGSTQTQYTTIDKLPPVEIFTVNPNIVKVSKIKRNSGNPILDVE